MSEAVAHLASCCLRVVDTLDAEYVCGEEFEQAVISVAEILGTSRELPDFMANDLTLISKARKVITLRNLDTRTSIWMTYQFSIADLLWIVESTLTLQEADAVLGTSPNDDARVSSFPLVFPQIDVKQIRTKKDLDKVEVVNPDGLRLQDQHTAIAHLTSLSVIKILESLSWKLVANASPSQRTLAFFTEFRDVLRLLFLRVVQLSALKLQEELVGFLHQAPNSFEVFRDPLDDIDSDAEDEPEYGFYRNGKPISRESKADAARRRREEFVEMRSNAKTNASSSSSTFEKNRRRELNMALAEKYPMRKCLNGDDGIADLVQAETQSQTTTTTTMTKNKKRLRTDVITHAGMKKTKKTKTTTTDTKSRIQTNVLFHREGRFYTTWLESDVNDALDILSKATYVPKIEYKTIKDKVRRVRERLLSRVLRGAMHPDTQARYYFSFFCAKRITPCDHAIYYTREGPSAQEGASDHTILANKNEAMIGYEKEAPQKTFEKYPREVTDCLLNYLATQANSSDSNKSLLHRLCVDWRLGKLFDVPGDGVDVHFALIQPLNVWVAVYAMNPKTPIIFPSFTHAFVYAKMNGWIKPELEQFDELGMLKETAFSTVCVDPEIFMRSRDPEKEGNAHEDLDEGYLNTELTMDVGGNGGGGAADGDAGMEILVTVNEFLVSGEGLLSKDEAMEMATTSAKISRQGLTGNDSDEDDVVVAALSRDDYGVLADVVARIVVDDDDDDDDDTRRRRLRKSWERIIKKYAVDLPLTKIVELDDVRRRFRTDVDDDDDDDDLPATVGELLTSTALVMRVVQPRLQVIIEEEEEEISDVGSM